MNFLVKNNKKLSLIAAILLGIAVLSLVVPMLLGLWDMLEGLFAGRSFETILDGMIGLVRLGSQGLVPMAFIVFAFVYMRTGCHHYLLAVAAGVALAQMLLDLTLSLMMFVIRELGSKYFLDYLFGYGIYEYLPSDLFPYLLFVLTIVFVLKKKGSPLVVGAVAALTIGLLLNGLNGQSKSFINFIYGLIDSGIDFERVLKRSIYLLSYSTYTITWYGGLLLLVPAALQSKVSVKLEQEELPEGDFVSEEDFVPEAE